MVQRIDKVFTDSSFTEQDGGAEKILLEIIDMLNGDGHETVLYTLDRTDWGRLKRKVGCQLSRFREAEDITNVANGAWFNFRVRNGIGWVPRPLAGYPASIQCYLV